MIAIRAREEKRFKFYKEVEYIRNFLNTIPKETIVKKSIFRNKTKDETPTLASLNLINTENCISISSEADDCLFWDLIWVLNDWLDPTGKLLQELFRKSSDPKFQIILFNIDKIMVSGKVDLSEYYGLMDCVIGGKLVLNKEYPQSITLLLNNNYIIGDKINLATKTTSYGVEYETARWFPIQQILLVYLENKVVVVYE